jgi:hypothetical protein
MYFFGFIQARKVVVGHRFAEKDGILIYLTVAPFNGV